MNLFRLHAILATLCAEGLVLAPESTIGLLSPLPLNAVAADLARLLGAALVLVAFIAWRASLHTDRPRRRIVAGGLLVHTTLGAIITVCDRIRGTWSALGWSSVISYSRDRAMMPLGVTKNQLQRE